MIYTYECTNDKCLNQFTVWKGINEVSDVTHCPKCAVQAKRIYNAANMNLNFKGSYNSTRK
jgi:putative FmdB family regulatory protein